VGKEHSMETMLNEREQNYLHNLMTWDKQRLRLGWFFMLLLVIGGVIIVIAAYLTLLYMNHKVVVTITLPGFYVGIILILSSIAGVRWIQERHLMASIVKKLNAKELSSSPSEGDTYDD
jgi:hypothetical protein